MVRTLLALSLLAACRSEEPPTQALRDAAFELAEPFELPLADSSRPIVRVDIDDRPPLRFLVDCGAELSMVAGRAADAGGWSRRAYSTAITASGSSGRKVGLRDYVRCGRIAVGELVLRDVRLTVVDDDALAVAGVDGVLGQDLLARLPVIVDMQRHALHLLPRGGREAIVGYVERNGLGKGAWIMAPIEFRPCPVVTLDMPGLAQPVELELDTGAVGSSLPGAAIAALRLEPVGTRSIGGLGGTVEAKTYAVHELDLWGVRLALEVAESAIACGLLGMDVLGEFVVVLDGPERMLWLHRRHG